MHRMNDADIFMRVGGVVLRRETDKRGEVAKGNRGLSKKGREKSEKLKQTRK